MFSRLFVSSDRFLDTPLTAQSLYFHLSLNADDDGFVGNPKTIQRMIGADDKDMKALVDSGLLIPFKSGVIAVRHWKINNQLRSDRYKPTVYAEERAFLTDNGNGEYIAERGQTATDNQPTTNRQPNGNPV